MFQKFQIPIVRAYIIIKVLSEYRRFLSFFKPDVVHWTSKYDGQEILLLALFQKGKIRKDTSILLDAAKNRGMYIIAVNSLALSNPTDYRDQIDHYIERFNFGRDFGSYKSGFKVCFSDFRFMDCPRLILMNDSVFVCKDRISKFLQDLLETKYEVLGATENHEIEHHLGSFCISMSQKILANRRFRRYWENYRNSDIRPTVIKRGEMHFSKVLKKCVTHVDAIGALYDSVRIHNFCSTSIQELNYFIYYSRSSDLVGWRRLSLHDVVNEFFDLYMRSTVLSNDVSVKLRDMRPTEFEPFRELPMSRVEDAISCFEEVLGRKLNSNETLRFRDLLVARATEIFLEGSQVHQNAALLVYLGLPIIKLDGIFRGMFSIDDMNKILECLSMEDASALKRLLLSRPFGGNTLRGWKREAFFVGLI